VSTKEKRVEDLGPTFFNAEKTDVFTSVWV
jgi:hypothetical protein